MTGRGSASALALAAGLAAAAGVGWVVVPSDPDVEHASVAESAASEAPLPDHGRTLAPAADRPAAVATPQEVSTEPTPEEAAWLAAVMASFDERPRGDRMRIVMSIHNLGPRASAAVDFLVARLRTEDLPMRSLVAGALARIGEAASSALAAALADPDETVRAGAADALSRNPALLAKHRDAVEAALKDGSEEVREAAARGLGPVGRAGPATVDGLLAALSDPARRVRAGAARSLGLLRSDAARVVPALALRIADGAEAEVVRRSAIDAVVFFDEGAEPAIAALLAATRGESVDVSEAAFDALRRLGRFAASAVPDLLAMTRTEFDPGWGRGARALSEIAPAAPSLRSEFVHWLADGRSDFAQTGLMRLGPAGAQAMVDAYATSETGSPDGYVALAHDVAGFDPLPTLLGLEALLGSTDSLAEYAALSLSLIGEPASRAIPALSGRLGRGRLQTREAVLAALGEVGRDSATAATTAALALGAEESSLRRTALAALGRIDVRRPGIVTAVERTLSDADVDVRFEAIRLLGAWGVDAAPAREALRRVEAADADSNVRAAAKRALERIDSGAAPVRRGRGRR